MKFKKLKRFNDRKSAYVKPKNKALEHK